jgi:tRNA threonylcarbamoyladenosine modification (KEOPS) complex Cgi121 subunit
MFTYQILGKYLIITGFKGLDKDTKSILELNKSRFEGSSIQFFDAQYIGGVDHLYYAVLNALYSFEKGYNISRTLEMEALLYASGQNQISKAIKILGVKKNSSKIALLIISNRKIYGEKVLNLIINSLESKPEDDVLDISNDKIKKIKDFFNISNLEIKATLIEDEKKALANLIIERVALLAIRT